jgi:hypothetical protein
MKKLLSKFLIAVLSLGVFSFISVQPAQASGSLYLSPGSTTVSQGSSFSVSIRTNTGGANVNAVQANLSYPADKLDFIGISTGGTSFEITAEGSGGSGSIRIGRGTISAKSGDLLVATVTFRAKPSSGLGSVSFAGGSTVVRASDSKNIKPSKIGGTYSFSEAPPAPTPKPKDKTAPKISNVKVKNLTRTSVTIAWTTNEKADSKVKWGPTKNFGVVSTSNKFVKSHSLNLNKKLLTPGSDYYYQVKSKDQAGNEGTSKISSFTVPGFNIKVKVTDENGNPVEGAKVTLTQSLESQYTDQNGVAEFKNASAGTQIVNIEVDGKVLSQNIEVKATKEGQVQDFAVAVAGVTKQLVPTNLVIVIVALGLVAVVLLGYPAFRRLRKVEKIE